MKRISGAIKGNGNRRSFLKKGLFTAGAATIGAGLFGRSATVFGQKREEKSGKLTPGDAAILRFLAAAEIIER